MSQNTLKKIFSWMLCNIENTKKSNKICCLEILGGEPLVHPNLIYRVANMLKESCFKNRGIFFSPFYTIGLLLNDNIVRSLKEKNIRLIFSLDGFSYSSNSHRFPNKRLFLKALNNAFLYKDEIETPLINMTFQPNKAKNAYEEVFSFIKKGFNKIKISPAYGQRWDNKNTKAFLNNFERILSLHKKIKEKNGKIYINPIDMHIKQILEKDWKKSSCELGRKITFTPSGDAYACTWIMLMNDSIKSKFYVGNIHKNIDSKKYFPLRTITYILKCNLIVNTIFQAFL